MKKILLAFALALSVTSECRAISVSVSDNIANDLYMARGDSVTGRFDINSVLPDNGGFNHPYTIEDASITTTITDDRLNEISVNYNYSSQYNSQYYYNAGRGIARTYYRYQYRYYLNEIDQIRVDVNTQVSTDRTNYFNQGWQSLRNSNSGWYWGGYLRTGQYLFYRIRQGVQC